MTLGFSLRMYLVVGVLIIVVEAVVADDQLEFSSFLDVELVLDQQNDTAAIGPNQDTEHIHETSQPPQQTPSLIEEAEFPWRPNTNSSLTVIWSAPYENVEHEWVDDWVLAKVRRPIVKIFNNRCPPGSSIRHNPKEVLWVVFGVASDALLTCMRDFIVQATKVKGIRFGLLHLADEFVAAPEPCKGENLHCYSPLIDLYTLPEVHYVLRNHWDAKFALPIYQNKVKWLPLGTTNGFGRPPANAIRLASARKNTCVFQGSPGDPIPSSPRRRFVSLLPTLDLEQRFGCRVNLTAGGWGMGLKKTEYRHLLLETTLTLCPGGNMGMDTFRIWEALTAGSIPIIEKAGQDWDMLGEDHPLLMIEDWAQLPDLFIKLNSKRVLDVMQIQVYNWWLRYVNKMQDMVAEVIG